LATAPVLAGGSGTTVIAGATTIGTATNPGILAPGLGDSAMSNQSMTFSNVAGVTIANGSQLQMSITTPTLTSGNGTVAAWLASAQTLSDYLTSNPAAVATVNTVPTYGASDFLNLTGGGLVLGTRAAAGVGNGALVIQNNGWTTPAAGDLFNLVDWMTALSGSFSLPGSTTSGGAYGDIDLPVLTGGLQWDVSALSSHGVVAVTGIVPEPSRMLLLALGALCLVTRRRRK
jgi:hypothetical protein